MDISCEKCQAVFKVSDDKIPKGQVVTIPCPKCKAKLTIGQSAASPPPKKEEPASQPASKKTDESVSTDSPFAFLEEGVETALICESDAGIRAQLKTALEGLNYKISHPDSPRDALKQMRFHDFNVVVINEKFGTRDPDMNHVLKYLGQLPMSSRRNIFVAMISERFNTMDSMMTYNRSVNLIINTKDIQDVEKILKRGISDSKAFYRVFKETLAKLGKV